MRAIHIRTFPRLTIIGVLLAVGVLLLGSPATSGAADAPSGFSATAADSQVTLTWNNPRDSTITGYQVLQVAIDKLVGVNSAASNRFGDSVGVDNNRAVVGAPREESLDSQYNVITDGGLGHVFRRGSSGRSGDGYLLLSAPQVNGRLGSSVAVASSTAVIGAPSYYQFNNTDPGRISIASRSQTGSWATEFTKIGQAGNDFYGSFVAVDDGIAVVGPPGALVGSDAFAGKVYLYTKDSSGVWRQAATAIWTAGSYAGLGNIEQEQDDFLGESQHDACPPNKHGHLGTTTARIRSSSR